MDQIVAVLDKLKVDILLLAGPLALLFIVIGGVRYAAAGHDDRQMEAAQKTIKRAAIGLGIAILAPVIIAIVKGLTS